MVDRGADPGFRELVRDIQARDGDVDHPPLDRFVVETTTSRCFQEAYELAEAYDVMTTVHVAEAEAEERREISSVEYLRNIGYLGERSLLAHCVQIDESDVRILAATDTAVAHNFMSNMRLATGFAPVAAMIDAGVTVGLGTDNSILIPSAIIT